MELLDDPRLHKLERHILPPRKVAGLVLALVILILFFGWHTYGTTGAAAAGIAFALGTVVIAPISIAGRVHPMVRAILFATLLVATCVAGWCIVGRATGALLCAIALGGASYLSLAFWGAFWHMRRRGD